MLLFSPRAWTTVAWFLGLQMFGSGLLESSAPAIHAASDLQSN